MKKIISILLLLMLTFGVLCACSSQQGEDDATETTTAPQSTPAAKDPQWYNFTYYETKNIVKDVEKLSFGALDKTCETYKFSYSSDRYQIKGFISIPLECIKTETPYNCIVYNRGGNSNMGWITGEEIASMCKETDRIVIASQYRGADGGEGKDEFGGKDIEDVTTLIDMCEKNFKFAKLDNLCMVGMSRGGMMAYMVARQDERVKGIVAISAVTDLAASYNERQDMRDILGDSIGGTPEELPEEYEKRSAICWTEDIKVPVFIIHNKGDELVSVTQAQDMNEKLSKSKYGCSMIMHNDNLHGLHQEDVYEIVEWIDQVLPKT